MSGQSNRIHLVLLPTLWPRLRRASVAAVLIYSVIVHIAPLEAQICDVHFNEPFVLPPDAGKAAGSSGRGWVAITGASSGVVHMAGDFLTQSGGYLRVTSYITADSYGLVEGGAGYRGYGAICDVRVGFPPQGLQRPLCISARLLPAGARIDFGASFYAGSVTGRVTWEFLPEFLNLGPPVPVPTPPGGKEVNCGGGLCNGLHIVIHGMSDHIDCDDHEPNDPEDRGHWSARAKNAGCQEGACVSGWDWHEGANAPWGNVGDLVNLAGGVGPGGWAAAILPDVGSAYRNAQLQGEALAMALAQKIEAGQFTAQQICFSGHSFGGVVAAIASKILCSRYGPVGEIVLIDTPQLWLVPGTSHLNPGCAAKVINIYGDHALGAVGGPVSGDDVINFGVDLARRGAGPRSSCLGNISCDCRSIPAGCSCGHLIIACAWPTIVQGIRGAPFGDYYEIYEPPSGLSTSSTCESSRGTSTIVPGRPDYVYGLPFTGYPATAVDARFDWAIEKLQNWAGQNVQLELVGDRLAVGLTKTPTDVAQLYRTNTIPHRAEYMEFEYQVVTPADGDEVVISYGDQMLYRNPVTTATGGFVKSGPIYVGDLAGTTNQFGVTVVGSGAAGSKIYVSNLQFYDVAGVAADFNHDGYVNSADWDHFQTCAFGPAVPQSDVNCVDADLDEDGDVDQSDFGIFQRCWSGPAVPADPGCNP